MATEPDEVATGVHATSAPAARTPGVGAPGVGAAATGTGDGPGTTGNPTDAAGGVDKTHEADQAALDRILTVPNAVTVARLACIPVFLWLLFGANRPVAASIVLAALGATDWVDGYVARRFHQVSTVGKVLDPVADRVLMLTAVISTMVHGAVTVWFGVATLARELLVSAVVLVLAGLGAERIDVLWVGKAGTFGLLFAYPAFLLADGDAGWQTVILAVAWVTGIVGLTLAWIAAAAYVPVARRALATGRAGRRGAG